MSRKPEGTILNMAKRYRVPNSECMSVWMDIMAALFMHIFFKCDEPTKWQ